MVSSELSAADIAAVTGNRGNDSFGYGNSWEWIIILFLFAMFNGNWGNNGNGGMSGNLYPWLNNSNQINDGFREQMLSTQVNGIQNGVTSGFGDLQTALCGGFAGINASITNAQINNMQNMNSLQSQLAQCCCDNRLATCQTQNIVQNEGAATRLAIQNQTQAILDKLCQLELDSLKQDNANLRTQLNMANLAASQVAQTAELRQNGAAQLNQLVSELRSCPIPAQPVYGSQPIFTCNSNQTGCGCGA